MVISNFVGRVPAPDKILVEYDCRGERKVKEFTNPYESRAFWMKKDKEGKRPKIRKG